MAINEETIILNVDDGSPYFIGSKAYVTQEEDGVSITIIDRDGTTVGMVHNGADGAAGADGNDGADGVSPAISVSSVSGGHRLTITDAYQTQTVDVMDGVDGEVNVQADWSEADSTKDEYIKNKPSIPSTAADVGAVPTSRTVNGKALSSNINLAASDVDAVPTTRTVNGKALSSNITLAASDVGAPTTADLSSLSSRVGTAETGIATNSARIDSFTNLAQGSTTGDAELIDGRVGADGVTYTNIGGAIRTQVSDLKSDLNSCFDKSLGKNRVNSADVVSGYLKSDGSLAQYSDWKTTGFCDVRGFSNIAGSRSLVGQSPSTRYTLSLFFLCTYDSSQNFIEQIDIGSATTWAVTDGVAYVRFSYHENSDENIQLESGTTITAYEPYKVIYSLKDECIEDTIESVDDLVDKFGVFYSTNRNPNNDTSGYLKSDGTITQYGDWKTTDYCYVADLDTIIGSISRVGELPTSRYERSLQFLCTYDANKNFIEQVYTTAPSTWTVENGVSYVRFCYQSNVDENVMLAGGTYIAPFVQYYKKTMLKPQYYDNNGDAKWSGKKWCAVGDSLTEHNLRTNVHYYDYISEATGINVNVMGASGTGYARGQDENKAFYQRISNVPTDSDVVTIFGSFNDLGAGLNLGTAMDSGTTTIGGCINTTLDNLFATYPLAQVGVVTPSPWVDANPLAEPNSASAYVSLIKEICDRRSIPCLDMFHESLLRPWESSFRALAYSKDEGNGTHPDETGHKIMSARFKAFLETLLI